MYCILCVKSILSHILKAVCLTDSKCTVWCRVKWRLLFPFLTLRIILAGHLPSSLSPLWLSEGRLRVSRTRAQYLRESIVCVSYKSAPTASSSTSSKLGFEGKHRFIHKCIIGQYNHVNVSYFS